MLRDGSVGVSESEGENVATWAGETSVEPWRACDRALCRIGQRRAELDAEEAKWLREAHRLRIWREVGCVSLVEYLEDRLGYAPRTAQDRLRVAFALAELPGLTRALETGEHKFAAVRELVRVVTPAKEDAWLEKCRGMNAFQVQQEVSGHKKGDGPGDPRDPDLRLRSCRFEDVRPSTIALERQARAMAQKQRGERLSDDEFLTLIYSAYLAGLATSAEGSERARYQVAVTLCERCEQGWQEGAGRKFAMDASEVARAKCDAEHIGTLQTGEPARAKQDVPPRVRRFVQRRDGGKCTLSSCRSSSNLELHHIVPREAGGSHEPWNILQLCDGHHAALHRGLITITGRAPDQLTIHRRDDLGPQADATVSCAEPDARVGTAAERAELSAHASATAERTEPSARAGTAAERGESSARVCATAERAERVARAGATATRTQASAHADATATRTGPSARVGATATRTEPSARVGATATRTEPSAHAGARSMTSESDAHAGTVATPAEPSARAGARSKYAEVAMLVEARLALTTLGFKRHQAARAVDAARAHAGADVSLESLIREALKRCARPAR